MIVSFPTIVSCVFAAYLYGGPDLVKHSYEPVIRPSEECHFVAWVKEGEFHLQRDGHEVFIPLPIHTGAYLSVPGGISWYQVPVRMGSADFY